jgi:hypothetical protein
MPEAKSRRIVITAYDGISLLELAGPLEAFRIASTFSAPHGRLSTASRAMRTQYRVFSGLGVVLEHLGAASPRAERPSRPQGTSLPCRNAVALRDAPARATGSIPR